MNSFLKQLFNISFRRFRTIRVHGGRRLACESLETRIALATFTVTTVADQGANSLRQAILAANSHIGPDVIEFHLPGTNWTIRPTDALPFVSGQTVIDGTSQSKFAGAPGYVKLDGVFVSSPSPSGIVLSADDCVVSGLHVFNFDYGITILGGSRNSLISNALGADPTGMTETSNRVLGVYLIDAIDNRIGTGNKGNLLSSNAEAGVRIDGASHGNMVSGNLIGTDASGEVSAGPQNYGVLIYSGDFNFVGTDGDSINDALEGNVLSGNTYSGVSIGDSSSNVIAGNLIGLSGSGLQTVGSQDRGIEIAFGGSHNVIGTNSDGISDAIERNYIGGNTQYGVSLFQATQNLIAGNVIGLLKDGITPAGNSSAGINIDSASNENQIGESIAPNFIADNAYAVFIRNSSSVTVSHNVLGFDVNRQLKTNHQGTVFVQNGLDVVIGGTVGDAGNLIGFDDKTPIKVTGDSRCYITANNYLGDTSLVVDLSNNGPTTNDQLDADTGPNGLQNKPVVSAVASDGNLATVVGYINTTPWTAVSIEILASLPPQSGLLSLQSLSTISVLTDQLGNANWQAILPVSLSLNSQVAALAHVESTGTSELSNIALLSSSLILDPSSTNIEEPNGAIEVTVHRPLSDLTMAALSVNLRTNDGTRDRLKFPSHVVIPAGELSTSFVLAVNDNQFYIDDHVAIIAETSDARGLAILQVTDDDSPWHNYLSPLDVNASGTITPADALLIINYLNTGTNRLLGLQSQSTPPVFYDSVIDGRVAPSDALTVINFLNMRGASEGEAGQMQPITLASSTIGIEMAPLLGYETDESASRSKRRDR